MRMISFLRHRKTLWTIFQYDACVGQDLSLKYDSKKVSCLKATRFQIQVRHLENYNYIIVLFKSYDAAYRKSVKEIPV